MHANRPRTLVHATLRQCTTVRQRHNATLSPNGGFVGLTDTTAVATASTNYISPCSHHRHARESPANIGACVRAMLRQ